MPEEEFYAILDQINREFRACRLSAVEADAEREALIRRFEQETWAA